MRNHRKDVDKIKAKILFSITFSGNCTDYEAMWKNR
jgi:hypothetical protein